MGTIPQLAEQLLSPAAVVPQLITDGLIHGSAYGLLGVAMALILGVARRFHFAFAFTYALAAYSAALILEQADVPFAAAFTAALVIGTLAGVLIELLIYQPIERRSRDVALLPVFVASLGITIAGESLIRLYAGTAGKPVIGLPLDAVSVDTVTFIRLDVIAVCTFWALIVATAGMLAYTDLGRRIKAVRANHEMALAVGIRPGVVYLIVFAIGSFLASVASVFDAAKFVASPEMGLRPVFYALVVAFLAGTHRSPLLLGLTGLGVGVVESISTLWLTPQLSSLVVFALLVLYLSFQAAKYVLEPAWSRYTQDLGVRRKTGASV